jgi:hypothetical protein
MSVLEFAPKIDCHRCGKAMRAATREEIQDPA